MDPTQATPSFGVPLNTAPAAPSQTPAAQPAPQKYVEQDGKHKGVAGVARDILGTLGDFLLTKLGVGPMYAPAQRQRKLAIAQQSFNEDPLGAINQVTSIDANMGAKMREQFIDNQRIAAQNAATNKQRDSRLALAKQAQDEKTSGVAASMLGSMHDWTDEERKQKYPTMRKTVIDIAKRKGLDLSSDLPEEFDEATLDAFISGAVPVTQQRAQLLTKDRNEALEDLGKARIETTRRGQTITSNDRRRGQDITSNDRASSREVTKRGQNIASKDRAANRAVTIRGQNIRASAPRDGDVRRGKAGTPYEGKTLVRKSGRWVVQQ